MKILVCITHVPDTTSRIAFKDNNTAFDNTGVQFVIGPYDDYAIARAIELKEAGIAEEVVVLNVGTAETEPTIRKGLALGADRAVRIDCAPTNSVFTAQQIANYAKDQSFDLILMGRESSDYNGGVVHSLVGEMLGMPALSPVMVLELNGNEAEITREIEGGKEKLKISLPFVAGCQEPIAEWKIPNMRGIMTARSKPLEVIAPEDVDAGVTTKEFSLPAPKSGVKMVDAENVSELVNLLKNEAKVL